MVYLDDTPVSVTTLEQHYRIKSNNLQRQYKNHLSSYENWDQNYILTNGYYIHIIA